VTFTSCCIRSLAPSRRTCPWHRLSATGIGFRPISPTRPGSERPSWHSSLTSPNDLTSRDCRLPVRHAPSDDGQTKRVNGVNSQHVAWPSPQQLNTYGGGSLPDHLAVRERRPSATLRLPANPDWHSLRVMRVGSDPGLEAGNSVPAGGTRRLAARERTVGPEVVLLVRTTSVGPGGRFWGGRHRRAGWPEREGAARCPGTGSAWRLGPRRGRRSRAGRRAGPARWRSPGSPAGTCAGWPVRPAIRPAIRSSAIVGSASPPGVLPGGLAGPLLPDGGAEGTAVETADDALKGATDGATWPHPRGELRFGR